MTGESAKTSLSVHNVFIHNKETHAVINPQDYLKNHGKCGKVVILSAADYEAYAANWKAS
jgi:hypothetical protein